MKAIAIRTACAAVSLLASLPLSGCITIQAIEPVIAPPAHYKGDVTVPVEFLAAPMVGVRCAERGAKFIGLPALNSGACSDRDLMTMPDPCLTLTAGLYADTLCHQIAISRETPDAVPAQMTAKVQLRRLPSDFAPAAYGDLRVNADAPQLVRAKYDPVSVQAASASAAAPDLSRSIPIEFVTPDRVAYRCAERGAKFIETSEPEARACADDQLVTMVNPCALPSTGWYTRMLCHELAHANGWPANHSREPQILRASQSALALAWSEKTQKEVAPPRLPAPVLAPATAPAPVAVMQETYDIALKPVEAQRVVAAPSAEDMSRTLLQLAARLTHTAQSRSPVIARLLSWLPAANADLIVLDAVDLEVGLNLADQEIAELARLPDLRFASRTIGL